MRNVSTVAGSRTVGRLPHVAAAGALALVAAALTAACAASPAAQPGAAPAVTPATGQACSTQQTYVTLTVGTAAPVGIKPIVDLATGKPILFFAD